MLHKNVALQNLSIYYTYTNIRQQYKNKKLKITVPTWNDALESKLIFEKFLDVL